MLENNDDFHFVSVMFESRYGSTKDDPKFYGKAYTYKTKRDLKKGQVVEIETTYGNTRVCVLDENLDKSSINIDLDIIKEI